MEYPSGCDEESGERFIVGLSHKSSHDGRGKILMIGIAGYGCSTSAGLGVSRLWEGLSSGRDFSAPVKYDTWPKQPLSPPRACLIPESCANAKTKILQQLRFAWSEACETLSPVDRAAINSGRTGVIFASTKGFVDDVIWQTNGPDLKNDFLTPILRDFMSEADLKTDLAVTVSNACASTVSALWLSQQWIIKNLADVVIVLAADLFGPFVYHGFSSLDALSKSRVRPFASQRDGLQLGEAAVAIILSRHAGGFGITGTGIDAEGYAVTRPSPSGASITRAITEAAGATFTVPELIIAHGTGTMLNDSTEDRAFDRLYGAVQVKPAITASKWSIGHCLGASGAVDVILGCEALKRQDWFSIANTETIDTQLTGRYLTKGSAGPDKSLERVLVTSLGFGGIHAAVFLERGKC
jgi:3-oxoacyl-(acyl-carrier-protein) synthase